MTDSFGDRLSWIDQALGRVEGGLNLLAGILVFALMFLGVAQIILRTVFRAPIFGYIDLVEVSMVGFAVLSIAFVQRMGGHVRMEVLVAKLRGRWLWLAEAFNTLLAVFIVAVLIPYSWNHFMRAFEFGDSTIDIEIVTWPAKLVVPLALGLLLVRLLVQLAGYWRLFLHPGLVPVAVPVVRSIESQADEEIGRSGEGAVRKNPGRGVRR
ncbi:MAG: TRAP transporter small permease [Gammaproteobacteria bacterium]|nr:TRAP transporter small permease [Gammaproteobacteria bacterium]